MLLSGTTFKAFLPVLLGTSILRHISLESLDFHGTFHFSNSLHSVNVRYAVGIECNTTEHSHFFLLSGEHLRHLVSDSVKGNRLTVTLSEQIVILLQKHGSRVCLSDVTAVLDIYVLDFGHEADFREAAVESAKYLVVLITHLVVLINGVVATASTHERT